MSHNWIVRVLAGAVACSTALLSSPIANSYAPAAKLPHKPAKQATTGMLGGADRFLTMVSTDKPIYHEGERVYIRGVLLNAADHKPLSSGHSANATMEIKGPKGDTVASGNAQTTDSVWGCAWDVPRGQAGGEYTLRITYPWDGYAPAERKFEIRAYRAPRLKSQITFLRDGYGPGEKVNATLDVKRAEGGIPEGAKVTVSAVVDGRDISGGTAKVGADGLCHVSLDLPHHIPRGEGTLALIIEDGGVVETASKTIPILLQTVDVQLYPEGGDLIAGYPNRVYVEAKQPNGKPADIVAKLISKNDGGTVAAMRTEHEGRGRFTFTPHAGSSYYLSISQPAGIKTTYTLPAVKLAGAVIQADKNVFAKDEPISVHVGSTEHAVRITLSKREVELASTSIKLQKGVVQPVALHVLPNVDGVLTVTVWDTKGAPLAERLVFRQPASQLNITIKPDSKTYIPGERPKLTVKTTDLQGKPTSAVVGLTVTDDSVLEMVEKRDQAPRLPVMLFLEPEVKDLADAHVYLDPKNAKAPLATDLLLGTQGWRRFALMNLVKFVEDNGDQARRSVAMKICAQSDMSAAAAGNGGARFNFAANDWAAPVAAPAAAQLDAPLGEGMGEAMGAPISAGIGHAQPLHRKPVDQANEDGAAARKAEVARDTNFFQVEPAVLDERFMRAGRAERSLKFGALVLPAPANLQSAIAHNAENKKTLAIAAGQLSAALNNLVYVREFAHEVRKNRKSNDRSDFAETLYWNSGVKTDPKTGEATVSFGLNDSVSTFRVFADGFSGGGAVGAANIGVESVQPFYAEAKMPLEVTSGDRVLLPISMVNSTDKKVANGGMTVDLKGDFKLSAMQRQHAEIGAHQRVRSIQPITIGFGNQTNDVVITARAGGLEDKVTRQMCVKPKGFPIETAFGGILTPGKPVTHSITIPAGIVPRSMVSNTAIYPTPLANLTEAMQRLIQDPCGCFEQTSSTSYPLTMAQQYFLTHAGVDPKLVEQSRTKLDTGYKMLVGFWCPDRGYEWFGENPGHEALTAFGLLHFSDMAKVREVDQNMVATTRAWLLKQKDGSGGFSRKRRSLHTWIEDKDDSNAYIVWALLESGQKADELKPELAALKTTATKSHNNYVVALAANAEYLAGDKDSAKSLMERLAAKQKPDGSVDGVESSIVGSGGDSLAVEGTSLATLAWLRDPAYAPQVDKSVKFLADSCQGGRYGSTQSTVLALRAIVAYDQQRARPKAPGRVRVYVDGQSIGDWAAFGPDTQGAIKLPNLTELLTPGTHKLELRMEGGAPMPYSMAVKYNALTPATDKNCKLDIGVKMQQDKLVEGAATEVSVTVTNKTNEKIPTPVAIVGLPGGMEPRHDQLKELVKKGKIDAYEVRGREVVLYWRSLPENARVTVPISLIAAIPGSYTGPASRAYLYYTDEHKRWVDGMHVEIAAK